ncbi:hypothetical protein [Lysobacter gummosus]|uniref:hypothetical protein n=1 Tax=Lysobacter gummosus TaxID=262324 RepID=UPI0036256CA0
MAFLNVIDPRTLQRCYVDGGHRPVSEDDAVTDAALAACRINAATVSGAAT